MGKPCAASDQYALGVVIYDWLCGTLPFVGSFAEVGQQHLFAPPPTFEEQGVQIAPAVEAVVRRALAKKPEERFIDMQGFAQALEESFLQRDTLTSIPAEPRTEQDIAIFVQNPDKKPTVVEKMTEPVVPPILASTITNAPKHNLGTQRDLMKVLYLLLLILLVMGTLFYILPLFRREIPHCHLKLGT